MRQINLNRIHYLISFLSLTEGVLSKARWQKIEERVSVSLYGSEHEDFGDDIDDIISILRHMNMNSTASSLERLKIAYLNFNSPGYTAEHIEALCKDTRHRLYDDLKIPLFFSLVGDDVSFFQSNESPFGDTVRQSFPSATFDIDEASKCLALRRSTACVMHLNRALEACLRVIAKSLNISEQDNWGQYITKIHKKIEEISKTSERKSSDEEFYSSLVIYFDAVRRAYRNRVMHLDKKYDYQQAIEIFNAVKIFMKHLSTQITE